MNKNLEMTNEEARYHLECRKDFATHAQVVALDKAIDLLRRETCEDCISRKAVLKLFVTHDRKSLYEAIEDMPSVQPKKEPKTDVLDKIRAEIIELRKDYQEYGWAYDDVLEIIDKYRKEI